MKYYCTEKINKPIEYVFAKYFNSENLPLWFENFAKIEPHQLNQGGYWSSATLYLHGKKGQERIHATILAFEPPRRIVMRFAKGEVAMTNETLFEALGDYTYWRQNVTYETRGLSRLVAYADIEGYRSCTQKKMQSFVRFCEASDDGWMFLDQSKKESEISLRY